MLRPRSFNQSRLCNSLLHPTFTLGNRLRAALLRLWRRLLAREVSALLTGLPDH